MSTDNNIIELLSTLDKKAEEARGGRFHPKTTCILTLYGVTYNIHQLDDASLRLLAILLESLIHAEPRVFPDDPEVIVSGFTLRDWQDDVVSKAEVNKYRADQEKIKRYKGKLKDMLSAEKKTELEFQTIANELSGLL